MPEPYVGGTEFLVNTTTANIQSFPTVTDLAGGGFVVTWQDESSVVEGDRPDLKAQIYDLAGNKVGGEIAINTVTSNSQFEPQVSSLSSGGFVVTWYDWSELLGDNAANCIAAQIFDATGAKVGNELLVNTQTQGYQFVPTVTGLSSGGFVVTWEDSSGVFGDDVVNNPGIAGQMFDASGTKVGPEFLVNTMTALPQYYPAVASLAGGGFVVTWEDHSGTLGDDSSTSIKGQVYDASGLRIGSEFLVNTSHFGDQVVPSVTGLASGGFVITWTDYSGTNGDSDGAAIKGQIFDKLGAPVGTEFLINTQTANDQDLSAVSSLVGGGFVVTWNDYSGTLGDNDVGSIKAQAFDANGVKVGGEILVNDQTLSEQFKPTVSGLGSGGFVVTWQDYSGTLGDTDGSSIKAKLFIPNFLATDGPDHIVGTAGNDTIDGKDGNDSIFGNNGADSILGGAGSDSLDGGDGNDTLLGGSRWDTLVGGAGDDSLDGGADNDQMYGGTGNDIYVVDNVGDRVYEYLNEGSDTVFSSISWSLSADVEALVLTGSGNLTGTGNGLANAITGNSGANTLSGGAGADTLDGGLGADSLDGGIGNDVLLGDARWDTLVGGDGNDTLDGGLDNDQMYGGLGNDVYYVDNAGDRVYESTTANEGSDTVYASVSWDMTANVEAIVLTGTSNISSTGNSLSNTMTGNGGNNAFVGGIGADTILGLDGDDSIDGGIDSDQLDGGNGNDTLLGGQRWDTLTGGAGDDVLDGGTENDRMTGGTGNDTYYVDNVGDRVYENANEGTDTVYSTIDFALGPDVENLILQGTAVTGTGNGLNNKITGNSQANTLSGGNGNDTLTGGLGNDLLTGGTGRDDFVFSSAASNGTDHITDFVHLTDRLVFTGSDYGFSVGHALTAAEFTVGTSAIGTGAQFIWDPTSHHLYYDQDGTGATAAVDLALIDNGATVAKEDLFFT